MNFLALISLCLGVAIGWLLRSEDVWKRDVRIEQLLDDLDAAVRDVAATIGKRNHPAGRALRSVSAQDRQR